MARIRFSSAFTRAFTVQFWLIVSALSFAILAIVGREVYSAFYGPGAGVYRPTGVEQTSSELLCTPMWQKPLDYGVKVYASLEQDAFSNPQEFFKSAQLLWHSEPVSLDNQYPKLATTAAVDIPDALYSADSINATLYAHIFIQAASNLVPHPDVHDASLIHSTAHLARWRPLVTSDNYMDNYPMLFELVAATKIPWATFFENHTYKLKELPSYISNVASTVDANGKARIVCNPPVFENIFTEPRNGVERLALLNPRSAKVYDSNKTIAVELKLQGIHRGWMHLFKYQIENVGIINSTDDFTEFGIDLPNIGNPSPVPNPGFQIPANTRNGSSFVDLSLKSQVIACILVILKVPAFFLKIQTNAAFWLGSRSKWTGVSRFSILAVFSSLFIKFASKWYSKGGVLPLVCMAFALSVLLKMVELPAKPWKWSSYISEKLVQYNQAAAGSGSEDKQGPDLATTRRSIDYAASKIICGVGLVFPVVTSLLIFAIRKESVWSMLFIVDLVGRIDKNITWLWFLPQMVLNHAAHSGSLIPPAISISTLYVNLLMLGIRYTTTLSGFALTSADWSGIISSVIFVVQWIIYR